MFALQSNNLASQKKKLFYNLSHKFEPYTYSSYCNTILPSSGGKGNYNLWCLTCEQNEDHSTKNHGMMGNMEIVYYSY